MTVGFGEILKAFVVSGAMGLIAASVFLLLRTPGRRTRCGRWLCVAAPSQKRCA